MEKKKVNCKVLMHRDHMYFLNNDEIRDGDYYFYKSTIDKKCYVDKAVSHYNFEFMKGNQYAYFKIIASSNSDLKNVPVIREYYIDYVNTYNIKEATIELTYYDHIRNKDLYCDSYELPKGYDPETIVACVPEEYLGWQITNITKIETEPQYTTEDIDKWLKTIAETKVTLFKIQEHIRKDEVNAEIIRKEWGISACKPVKTYTQEEVEKLIEKCWLEAKNSVTGKIDSYVWEKRITLDKTKDHTEFIKNNLK